MAWVLQQDKLQRRLGYGEVGVAGAALGGPGAEQLAVEADRLVDVVDVERELYPGHGLLDREKRGVWVYYRARTEALASLATLIGSPAPSAVPE